MEWRACSAHAEEITDQHVEPRIDLKIAQRISEQQKSGRQ
jgi:hypothetical protein